MCRPSRFKAQGLHRAAPPGTLVQERTTHVGSKKQVAVPFWLLLLLFLLVSLWLMMALLSDSMLLRVPPSTERQQVISTAVKPLQPSGGCLSVRERAWSVQGIVKGSQGSSVRPVASYDESLLWTGGVTAVRALDRDVV